MFPLQVKLDLNKVICYDETDPGSAEPYLWTVFFKVDGETVEVIEENNNYRLSGTGIIRATPGSHGNLGTTSVDSGETVQIPANIGEWQSTLQPIPVPESLQGQYPNGIGGMIGVTCILMEQDKITDHGAEAGHKKLNEEFQRALNAIIPTIDSGNQDITDEIAEFEASIKGSIEDAIRRDQSWWENIKSWFNPDDMIGVRTFLFRHDDLEDNPDQSFSQRWKNEGDWAISGTAKATGGPITHLLITVNKVKIVDTALSPYTNEPPASVRTRFFAGVNGEFRAFPTSEDFDFPNNQWVELPRSEYTFVKNLSAIEKLRIHLHTKLPGILHVNPKPPYNITVGPARQLQVINEFREEDTVEGNQISRAFGEGTHMVRSGNNAGHFEAMYRIQFQEIVNPLVKVLEEKV